MEKQHRETIIKFITNVEAYREVTERAKVAAKNGDHARVRSLNNDAQLLAASVDTLLVTSKQILSATQISIYDGPGQD